jgi:hypothetical protein
MVYPGDRSGDKGISPKTSGESAVTDAKSLVFTRHALDVIEERDLGPGWIEPPHGKRNGWNLNRIGQR